MGQKARPWIRGRCPGRGGGIQGSGFWAPRGRAQGRAPREGTRCPGRRCPGPRPGLLDPVPGPLETGPLEGAPGAQGGGTQGRPFQTGRNQLNRQEPTFSLNYPVKVNPQICGRKLAFVLQFREVPNSDR